MVLHFLMPSAPDPGLSCVPSLLGPGWTFSTRVFLFLSYDVSFYAPVLQTAQPSDPLAHP